MDVQAIDGAELARVLSRRQAKKVVRLLDDGWRLLGVARIQEAGQRGVLEVLAVLGRKRNRRTVLSDGSVDRWRE